MSTATNSLRYAFFAFCVVISLNLGALMGDDGSAVDLYQEALEALSSSEDGMGERSQAMSLLKQAVALDYAPAMNLLGNLYLEGGGLFNNTKKANRMFQRAADLNDPIAQFNLGYSYRMGRGVDKDLKKAEALFLQVVDPKMLHVIEPEDLEIYRAAKASAYYNLGGLYDSEDGFEKDVDRAVSFMKESEKLGQSMAAMYLAVHYALGKGTEKSIEDAIRYLDRYNLLAQNAYRISLGNNLFIGMDRDVEEFVQSIALELANELDESIVETQVAFGVAMLKEGDDYDPDFAFRWLSLVEDKSEIAALRLARLYFRGEGVEVNHEKARSLLERIGNRFPVATYNLAVMQHHGYGGPKDEALAKVSLQNSADRGLYVAMKYLESGGELEYCSYDECLQIAEKAAESGDLLAKYCMANRYYYGFGVARDRDKSRLLMKEAAEAGVAPAQFMLGTSFLGIFDEMFTKRWVNAAASQGYLPALNYKAEMSERGYIYNKDLSEAVRLYKICVEAGYSKSMRNLGMLYRSGEGVKIDLKRSFELFAQAAELGEPIAMMRLAEAYQNGVGVELDIESALVWLKRSSEAGSINSFFELGELYASGLLGKVDWESAVKQYREASDYGHIEAILALGRCYEEGLGVNQSLFQAMETYNRAVFLSDDKDASYRIAVLQGNPEWTNADPQAALAGFRNLEYRGYVPAIYQLAVFNLKGFGTRKNEWKAYLKFRKVAEYSESFLEMKIGGRFVLEEDEQFVAPNRNGMSQEEKDELDRVSLQAAYELGILCLGSSHRKIKDPVEGLLWLEAAGLGGHESAIIELAKQYRENARLRDGTEDAIAWNRKAANLGDVDALYELGRLHFENEEGAPNREEAIGFLKQAADEGHRPAIKLLEEQEIVFRKKEETETEFKEDSLSEAEVGDVVIG